MPIVRKFNHGLLTLGQMSFLTGEIVRALTRRRLNFKDLLYQLYSIGVMSQSVVLITGAFTGMVLAAQTYLQFHKVRMDTATMAVVSVSMLSQLGPVLTGLMVAGRVGSGIAAELGSMMVTDQIAALRALGTDPVRKLVVPRILAGLLMVPVLTIISSAVGMVGGWIVTFGVLRVASSVYWNSVVQGLYIQDVWMGLIKPFFLGFAIVSIGCHVGLRTRGGTQGVGRATTNAVVASSVAVIAINYLVTQLLIVLMY